MLRPSLAEHSEPADSRDRPQIVMSSGRDLSSEPCRYLSWCSARPPCPAPVLHSSIDLALGRVASRRGRRLTCARGGGGRGPVRAALRSDPGAWLGVTWRLWRTWWVSSVTVRAAQLLWALAAPAGCGRRLEKVRKPGAEAAVSYEQVKWENAFGGWTVVFISSGEGFTAVTVRVTTSKIANPFGK